jgi:hypothetical protein
VQASIEPIRARIVVQSSPSRAVVAATARGYTTALLSRKALRPRELPAGTDWYAMQFEHVTGSQATAMHRAGFEGGSVDTEQGLVA